MPQALDWATYREAVTGVPAGVALKVDNDNGDSFDFDAVEGNTLIHAVADYAEHFGNSGPPRGGYESAYTRLAEAQSRASNGAQIRWLCQHEGDVAPLNDILHRAGLANIQAEYRPAN